MLYRYVIFYFWFEKLKSIDPEYRYNQRCRDEISIKLPHQNGWSSTNGVKWRQREWFLRLYAAGVCDRILPHSTAALTAPGRTSAGHGAPTSCHQSDRRQLSPYIWRPPGGSTLTPAPGFCCNLPRVRFKAVRAWKVKRVGLATALRKNAKSTKVARQSLLETLSVRCVWHLISMKKVSLGCRTWQFLSLHHLNFKWLQISTRKRSCKIDRIDSSDSPQSVQSQWTEYPDPLLQEWKERATLCLIGIRWKVQVRSTSVRDDRAALRKTTELN